MTYQIMDLVCERANEKDWCLIFDSGPHADLRTIIWEYPVPSADGKVSELEIVFTPDGRILTVQKRQGDTAHTCTCAADTLTSTDMCIETLRLMARPGFEFDYTDAIMGPLWAA